MPMRLASRTGSNGGPDQPLSIASRATLRARCSMRAIGSSPLAKARTDLLVHFCADTWPIAPLESPITTIGRFQHELQPYWQFSTAATPLLVRGGRPSRLGAREVPIAQARDGVRGASHLQDDGRPTNQPGPRWVAMPLTIQ